MDRVTTSDRRGAADETPPSLAARQSGWRLLLADLAGDGWPPWIWAVVPLSVGLLTSALIGVVGWVAALIAWLVAIAAFVALLAAHAAGQAALGASGQEPITPESRWRGLVDALPEATLVLDGQGHVLHHNSAVADIFQNVRVGQPLSRAIRNPDLLASIDRATESPTIVPVVERIPFERRIAATVTRLPGAPPDASELPAVLVSLRDLSEQDKLAQMREDFVANASHELRTPLASLKGFLETLQGPARDDPAARERFLGLMASQADRMNRLIDDLLSLSRVEMRAHLPPRGIVDLNEAASYACQTLEPVARAAEATIKIELLDVPARIRGDRDQLVQVLLNLIQNAIVHGGSAPRIRVRIARTAPAGRYTLSVSDNGPGIAAEHLPRLTERFYRANVASSRAKGGTGLGLAIVKHIVARHRGELEISSKLGAGSTFSVTFDELKGAAGKH